MSSANEYSDRRREQRLPLLLTAHCQVGPDYLRGNLTDLSTMGLGLATPTAWPRGTPVRVALALPHSDGPRFCTLSGMVVRSNPGHVGMMLDQANTRTDRDVLQGFLAVKRSRIN